MKEIRLKTRVAKVSDSHTTTKDSSKSTALVNLDQANIEATEKEFFAIIEEVVIPFIANLNKLRSILTIFF